MKQKQNLLLATVALAIAACGGGSSSDEAEDGDNDTVGAEIAEDYNRQMDKAADVEAQLLESKKNIDAAVDDAEGAVEEDDNGVKN